MVAYLRRGQAYRDQRRFDEATGDWRQASKLAPEAPQPLISLGDHFDAIGLNARPPSGMARRQAVLGRGSFTALPARARPLQGR